GFQEASIEPTRIYQFEDAQAFLGGASLEVLAREVSGRVMGAFVRAQKPAAAVSKPIEDSVCCGSDCCA
ncbi:MAG: arsenite S-adenosylmethyltransferase, partial [Gemmatimonadota bacterium]